VSRIATSPEYPGETEPFTATFFLNNLSGLEAKNVEVELQTEGNFEVLDYTNHKHLEQIVRGETKSVSFQLKGVEGRGGNQVRLVFSYNWPGGATPVEQAINAYLPLDRDGAESSPRLTVEEFTVESTSGRNEYLLRLSVKNLGDSDVREVSLQLDGGDDLYFIGRSNVDYLDNIGAQEVVRRDYRFGVNQAAKVAHYPLRLTLNYKDKRGNAYQGQETISISPSDLDIAYTTGKPRVLISKYTLSEERILAGNMFRLTFFIENTHFRPVHNIKVSLGVIEVESTTGGMATGGTVFSPVDGSNSFFIGRIPAGTVVEYSMDLYVDPTASAKTYIVPVKIEYEDEDADSYLVDELINIPVTQEARLQLINLELPQRAVVGQPFSVVADIANAGRLPLDNVMVSIEGDFPKENASYFFGQMQIGASDYFEGTIIPDKEGRLTGNLVLSYLDNKNQQVTITEPFTVEVVAVSRREEMMRGATEGGMMRPSTGDAGRTGLTPENNGNSPRPSVTLYVVPALLLVAGGSFIFWRRRRQKKDVEMLNEHI